MRKLIFQFFHWYHPKGGLWKEVREQAVHLQWLGVSDVWLPPPYKSSAGSDGVGYDVYDLFDLGEFDQKGSVKTKYGTKKQFINAVKTLHRHSLGVMGDIVLKNTRTLFGIIMHLQVSMNIQAKMERAYLKF